MFHLEQSVWLSLFALLLQHAALEWEHLENTQEVTVPGCAELLWLYTRRLSNLLFTLQVPELTHMDKAQTPKS